MDSINTERRALRHDPQARDMWSMFYSHATCAPEHVAIEDGVTVPVRYGDLYGRALGVAGCLAKRDADRPVLGALLRNGADQAAVYLAALRQGWIYAPLSAEYPQQLLASIVERHGIETVIHDAEHAELAAHVGAARCIPMDTLPRCLDEAEVPDPSAPGAEPGACLMFTSGSTGQPKAVLIRQSAIINLVLDQNYVAIGPEDRIAYIANPAFDASLFELWGALLNGASLVTLDRGELLSPEAFASFLSEREVSVAFITTALFNYTVRQKPDAFNTLDTVLFGGEAADTEAVRAVMAAGGPRRLLNVYGPTECTTFTTAHLLLEAPNPGVPVPIGRSLCGVHTAVLDSQRRPVEDEVEGELYVFGEGVADGYLNDPLLTEQRFVFLNVNRYGRVRAYRTGDVVERAQNGVLTFRRRVDDQIKRRGYRFTLSEVDEDLRALPNAADAKTVQVDPAGVTAEIVSFVVPQPGSGLDQGQILNGLREAAPSFRRPNRIVLVPALPIGAHGKVDGKALRAMAERAYADETLSAESQPSDEPEVLAQKLFARFAGSAALSDTSSFFSAGGDSLAAAQLLLEVEALTGRPFAYAAFLEDPTVHGLARLIGGAPVASTYTFPGEGPPNANECYVYLGPRGNVFQRGLGEDVRLFWRCPFDVGEPDVLDFDTIEAHAQAYLSSLTGQLSTGPVTIAGYSYGAVLAIQLASEMRRIGRPLERLVLLDPDIDACCGRYSHGTFARATLSKRQFLRELQGLVRAPFGGTRSGVSQSGEQHLSSPARKGSTQSDWARKAVVKRRRAVLEQCVKLYNTFVPQAAPTPMFILTPGGRRGEQESVEREARRLQQTYRCPVRTAAVKDVLLHVEMAREAGLISAARTLTSILPQLAEVDS